MGEEAEDVFFPTDAFLDAGAEVVINQLTRHAGNRLLAGRVYLCQNHPAEIAQSVKSVRELYQDKKITVIFQPHLYTRTRDFYRDFYHQFHVLAHLRGGLAVESCDSHYQVECYKTPSGKLCIEVTQRIPILRVMSANGENYYLDNKGTVMPPDAKCVAHLADTGH